MMDSQDKRATAAQGEAEQGAQAVTRYVWDMLTATRPPDASAVPPQVAGDPAFEKLVALLGDLRTLSAALSAGDVHRLVYSRGFVVSCLKALQANLRHLTWQAGMIAEGDFTQKVDFLGDFSKSFNEMTDKLRTMTEQMRQLAATDALTHMPNRLSLQQFLERTFAISRDEGRPMSVMFFDLDHFKRINDTWGHTVGDQVLIAISALLATQFRESDMFGRMGGEEFIAVLPGVTGQMAMAIAERILPVVAREVIHTEKGEEISVTVSIGVTQMREDDQDVARMLDRVDEALYLSKEGGRNQARFK